MAQKWEYKTEWGHAQDWDTDAFLWGKHAAEIRLMLNQSGDEGWELVGTAQYKSGRKNSLINEYIFKRPKGG